MNELTTRCLDTFPEWLRSLGTDAGELSALLDGDALTTDAKRHVAAALNYLFKSLDLIPDGIEDLGFLDDAFVVRVAAKHALASNGDKAKPEALVRLAEGAALVEELLGVDYKRLVKYVEGLINGAARGRTRCIGFGFAPASPWVSTPCASTAETAPAMQSRPAPRSQKVRLFIAFLVISGPVRRA